LLTNLKKKKIDELDLKTKWKYADQGRKSADELADKASNADTRAEADKFIKKALKRETRCRFDHLFLSRNEEDLKKRVIYLI
jgi:DNA-binding TFAR19-related protein (PDSD5 family)